MKIVLSIIVLSTALIFAQEPAPDAAATRDDVLQLFSIMQINQQMHTMMDAMMKQQKSLVHDTARRKNPNINQQELDRLDRMMDETIKDFPVEGLLDDMVPVYQKHLSKTDVAAMGTFYSSPTGQKLLREMPAMTSEAMQAAYGRLQQQMEAMTERIDKVMKENEQQNPSPKAQPQPKTKPNSIPQSLQN
jgi:uncharacterized protein